MVVSDKTDEGGDHGRCSGLAAGGCELVGPFQKYVLRVLARRLEGVCSSQVPGGKNGNPG